MRTPASAANGCSSTARRNGERPAGPFACRSRPTCASAVFEQRELDLTMGYADVIWQGDANEQSLRLLAHCTSPTTPINITGPEHTSIRWLAERFGERFGRAPRFVGSEARTAWLEDTTASQRLFGKPRVPLERMIDWTADWIARGGASHGKPTHFETRDGRY